MTYIIAEIGNNHNGSIQKAKLLTQEAARIGVDAIKTQSFRGLDIVSPTIKMSDLPEWDNGEFEYWYQFAESLALPLEDHQELIDFTHKKGLNFITTPVSIDILPLTLLELGALSTSHLIPAESTKFVPSEPLKTK